MLDKLAGIEARYEELERLMGDPAYLNDYSKIADFSKERAGLEEIVGLFRQYRKQSGELDGARAMRDSETDPDLQAMAQEEFNSLVESLAGLEAQLTELLLPKDIRDDKNVIMEIRAGTGGDEAGLFVADLFRMYQYYAMGRNWKVDVTEQSETGVGGYKLIKFDVRGKGAYSRLKYESGVHRVQRVPKTEAQGRIHTSTVTVAVLPELDPVDAELKMADIEMEFFRASGAGGQHVQKNSTAVRMIHKPTGIVVEVQDERSQMQNRLRAQQIIAARIYEIEFQKRKDEQEGERRSQVGTGERSEKIRTYNWPQNRITDHRVGMSNYNLPGVMMGDLDGFIDELATRDQAGKLAAGGADDEE